jgi:hypothetical protein
LAKIIPSLVSMRCVTVNLVSIGLMAWLTVGLLSCGGQQNDMPGAAGDPQGAAAQDSVVIVLPGEDSVSAFALLRRDHEVVFRSSVMGKFVTAVDSLESSSGAFWVYTVNDTSPAVACDRFFTADGDTVRWHFRKSSP